MQFEEDLPLEERFQVFSCFGSNVFQFLSPLANHDRLLRFPFNKDCCEDAMNLLTLFESVDHHSGRVRHFLLSEHDQLFADHFGSNGSFRLVRHLIRGIEHRTYRQILEDLIDDFFNVLARESRNWNGLFKISQAGIPIDYR